MEILVLEASTSAAKAMLYHSETGQYETAIKRYPTDWDQDQQEALQTYQFLCDAAISLLAGRRDVHMIVLNTTWHSLALCDRRMRVATPVDLWSNLRAADLCETLRGQEDWAAEYYRKTGCQVNASYPFFKLLWYKDRHFILKRLRVADQGSIFIHWLTGVYGISESMASGSGLLNCHTLDYDEDLLAQLEISRENLPPIYPSNQTFPLSEEGARDLGLQEGIPVMLANPDGGMNQLGAGALKKGDMTLSVGTSGAMRLSVSKPNTEHNHGLWCYRSPKGWLAGAATSGACNCIDLVRENLFGPDAEYEQMEGEMLAEDRPIFLPFLFSERAPGWDSKRQGGFRMRKDTHTDKDCYQAVQEGVLFNLYQCYERLCADYGEPKRIRLSGGILHSERWTQMCADIFGKTLEAEEHTQSSLMGGAVLAMEKLGLLEDVRSYEPVISKRVVPNEQRHAAYMEQYRKYLECYHNG